MFKKYFERLDREVSKYNTSMNGKDFFMVRSYFTVTGFAVGVMAATISLLTQDNMVAATIIGTAFTTIGYVMPYQMLKSQDRKNNKKIADQLLKEYEQLTLEVKNELDKEKVIEELIKNNNDASELANFVKREQIKSLDELDKKMNKLG